MTLPEMREFRIEDARTIHRLEKARTYAEYPPHGPALTFTIDGIPMACVGYERISGGAIAWMILSRDAKRHPGVFWAIRTCLETTMRAVGSLWIIVRKDWPKAKKFARWLGFEATGDKATVAGFVHCLYVRRG